MCKENTVTISTHRYNKLRDLESNIKKGSLVIISNIYGDISYNYFSKEKLESLVLNRCNEIIKNLEKDLEKEKQKRRNWWNSKF